jgi:hypothetical protein
MEPSTDDMAVVGCVLLIAPAIQIRQDQLRIRINSNPRLLRFFGHGSLEWSDRTKETRRIRWEKHAHPAGDRLCFPRRLLLD